ncbi:6-phosphofructokinase [Aquabacterium sp.]|uniref:6-phosphofructokinase n=1 Tax=Aquabacterium sp. TaxID=1872578 RepID=UPI0037852ACD
MKIGLLTGGGDAPGLNAVLRALTKSLIHQCGAEVLGIEDGYLGLIEGRARPLDWRAVSGIVALGGTLLGTTNRVSPLAHEGHDRRDEVLAQARAWGLDGVVAVGGDGTMAIADALHRHGLPSIGVPKTIDNDIPHVERSFGFDTAVATITEALDHVQTTAQSHGRVMLVETMGRNAGWLALEAGIAGGADAILLPEIDYDIEAIAALCRARAARQRFTVICVAEGAKPRGGQRTLQARVEGAPEPERLGGVSQVLCQQLQAVLTSEVRATVLGHVQRGGTPTAADRVLATHYGNAAAALVREGGWGRMVAHEQGRIGSVALAAVAGGNRRVAMDDALLQCARDIGVCLGDGPGYQPA